MRFIAADWGTTRFRALRIEAGAVLDRVESEEGVSALAAGQHAATFRARVGHWLDEWPDCPVLLVGMVGSREGWALAPYGSCPASPPDLAARLMPVDLGGGRTAHIVPGLVSEPAPGSVDVMRGEETLSFGAGVETGLVCLPGTHSKWVEMRDGVVARFGSFMTGELYGLLRHHSMIGRPAQEPEDAGGFPAGLDALERDGRAAQSGLLHLLFGARAAVVAGRADPHALGPFISGLLTAEEIRGAFAFLGPADAVTIVAPGTRAALYENALERRGARTRVVPPEAALIAGLARIVPHLA